MANLMEKYGWNTWFLPMNAKGAAKRNALWCLFLFLYRNV